MLYVCAITNSAQSQALSLRPRAVQAVESWIAALECIEHRPLLAALFAKYIDVTLDYCQKNFKTVVPLPAINQVQTLCKILEGVLPQARPSPLYAEIFARHCTGAKPRVWSDVEIAATYL